MSNRKVRLFAAGSAALMRITSPPVSGYICPLCLGHFENPEALTLEHAPQKTLGGKAICLTCKVCNNTAGYSIDSAVSREKILKKLLDKDGTPTRVRLTHKEIHLNCEILQGDEAIHIRILPGQNNPANERQLKSVFEAGDTGGLDLHITANGNFRPRDAHVGYLKSAYLGAFAKFGYSWVLGVDTMPIREQILAPERDILPKCRIGIGQSLSRNFQNGFYFMEQPFTAMLVAIGAYGIMLPWIAGPSPREISEWAIAERIKSKSGKLSFVNFAPWPNTSDFVLDRKAEP